MSITVSDLVCRPCSNGDCKNHEEKVTVTDKITGLTIDVICACSNHSGGKI